MPPILAIAKIHHHRYYLPLTPRTADRPHAACRLDASRSPLPALVGCATDKIPALSASTPPPRPPTVLQDAPCATSHHHPPSMPQSSTEMPSRLQSISPSFFSNSVTRDHPRWFFHRQFDFVEARNILHDPAVEWADMAHTKEAISRIEEVVYAMALGVRWSVMGYDDTMLGLYNYEEIWYFVASDERSFQMGQESQLPDLAPLVEAVADFSSYPG